MFKLSWNEDTRRAYSKLLARTERYGKSRRKIWYFYEWKILDQGKSFGLFIHGSMLARSASVFDLMEAASKAAAALGHAPASAAAYNAVLR